MVPRRAQRVVEHGLGRRRASCVKRYLTTAKSAEAKSNLGRLVKDAISAFERESTSGTLHGADEAVAAVHQLCPTAAGIPGTVPKGEKIQPDPAPPLLGE